MCLRVKIELLRGGQREIQINQATLGPSEVPYLAAGALEKLTYSATSIQIRPTTWDMFDLQDDIHSCLSKDLLDPKPINRDHHSYRQVSHSISDFLLSPS